MHASYALGEKGKPGCGEWMMEGGERRKWRWQSIDDGYGGMTVNTTHKISKTELRRYRNQA